MTQDKNVSPPNDALLARYHAAQSSLDAANGGAEALQPSTQTRKNILNYAANIATDSIAACANKERAGGTFDTQKLPANDSQWKLRALATLAVFGISSLLLLQWERGTSEEKDTAFGIARPPIAAPATATAPQVAAAPTPGTLLPPKAPPPPATPNQIKPAPALAKAPANPSAGVASPLSAKAEQANAQAPLAAPEASAQPAMADSPVSTPAASAMAPAQPATTLRAAPAAKALGQNAAPSERAPTTHTATQQALFDAISQADATAVQQALASGADKNAKRNGTPAITLCVQSGQLYLVQLLITAGADVNAPDAQGITPLAHARMRGFDAIANTLVAAGAN